MGNDKDKEKLLILLEEHRGLQAEMKKLEADLPVLKKEKHDLICMGKELEDPVKFARLWQVGLQVDLITNRLPAYKARLEAICNEMRAPMKAIGAGLASRHAKRMGKAREGLRTFFAAHFPPGSPTVEKALDVCDHVRAGRQHRETIEHECKCDDLSEAPARAQRLLERLAADEKA